MFVTETIKNKSYSSHNTPSESQNKPLLFLVSCAETLYSFIGRTGVRGLEIPKKYQIGAQKRGVPYEHSKGLHIRFMYFAHY